MKLINKLLGASKEKEDQKNCFGLSDVGKERAANEDYFRMIPEKHLYIVADGMGGHNAGDVASLNATKMIDSYFSIKLLKEIRNDEDKIKDALITSLLEAHAGILKMAEKNRNYEGMGCTVVVALYDEGYLHLAHVGDARAYLGNPKEIKLLTSDHSYVMELVRRGRLTMEEARVSPLKNRLNQAIGASVDITPDYLKLKVEEGTRLLLCSDGLWDMLSDEQLYHILMQECAPKKICGDFIDMANFAGGHDNITALVVFNKTEPQTKETRRSQGDESLDTAGEYSYVFKEE